jgi:hypothetical protein
VQLCILNALLDLILSVEGVHQYFIFSLAGCKYRVPQMGFRHCQSQGQLVSVTYELIMSVLRHFCMREPIRCGRILNAVRLISSIRGCFTLFLSNSHVVVQFISVQYVSVTPTHKANYLCIPRFPGRNICIEISKLFLFLEVEALAR